VHHNEVRCGFLARRFLMKQLINMVMNYLSKIKKRTLMDLELGLRVNLNSRSMDNTQISDIKLSINAKNHKLAFPELLIISDHIVIAISFSYLELSKVSIKFDFKIFELLCVNIAKFKNEIIVLLSQRLDLDNFSLEIQFSRGFIFT
jgi:hypothetical protein